MAPSTYLQETSSTNLQRQQPSRDRNYRKIFKDKETTNNILEGHTDANDLDIPDYAKDWFRTLTKTPAERNLMHLDFVVSAERYAEVFKEADEKKSSSPEGLHYTLWKSLIEVEDYCLFL